MGIKSTHEKRYKQMEKRCNIEIRASIQMSSNAGWRTEAPRSVDNREAAA